MHTYTMASQYIRYVVTEVYLKLSLHVSIVHFDSHILDSGEIMVKIYSCIK